MGYRPDSSNRGNEDDHWWEEDEYLHVDGEIFYANDFKFHTDWNWLMPVVEKIEADYMYGVNMEWQMCTIDKAGENKESFPRIEVDAFTKISATYLAIVEFIKWHNENN